jgi:hypothetical protein
VASKVAGRTIRRLGARRLFTMELWKNERKEKGYKRQRRC